jgi:hypothetical protein
VCKIPNNAVANRITFTNISGHVFLDQAIPSTPRTTVDKIMYESMVVTPDWIALFGYELILS